MFSQRTSTYRFLSGRDCSCQNPTPCISSCIIVPLWLQPGPSDSFWPTCVLQYWRPTADQHLISKIVVNIRLGLGMIDYEILLRDSELIAKMLKELCLDNIIFYKHSVTCCTELEKKFSNELTRHRYPLEVWETSEQKNLVPGLFTLYCKLLCDCFKCLLKKNYFLQHHEFRQQILKLVWSIWKYLWNETDHEMLTAVLAKFLWTLNFIFASSHGKLSPVLFQVTNYIFNLTKMQKGLFYSGAKFSSTKIRISSW